MHFPVELLIIAKIKQRTLTSEILSTPRSIVLTSSYLRTRPYIAIITPELTNRIIVHCYIPWASKPCSIGRFG